MSLSSSSQLGQGVQNNFGVIYALLTYGAWGVLTLYWKWVSWLPSEQAIAHRVVWSLVLLLPLLVVTRKFSEFLHVFKQPRLLLKLTCTAFLIACNWFLFVWAVANAHVVQASLGYFINPLFNVLLGVVFLRERLLVMRWLAVLLAALGVVWQVWALGEWPWLSLLLAGTFAFYGLIRKFTLVSSTVGLAVETLMVLPIAIWYLLWGGQAGDAGWTDHGWIGIFSIVLSGLITIVPLVWFANAAKRLPLSTLGFFQYIAPILQLAIGVLVFHESFTHQHFISFGLMWLALALYTTDSIFYRRPKSIAIH